MSQNKPDPDFGANEDPKTVWGLIYRIVGIVGICFGIWVVCGR